MLKMVDGTGIIGVDMICPLGVSTPQPPNYDRIELEGTGILVLPNSLNALLERLELGGKTEQVQNTGKNLIDQDAIIDGKTINSSNGEVVNNTQSCITDFIHLKPETYTFSIDNVLQDVQIMIILYNDNKTFNKYLLSNKNQTSKIIITENMYARIAFNNVKSFILSRHVMMEIGSNKTDYEPYTGGKPAPSPEYPQEIVNSGKLNADTQKYEVSVKLTGKNLFDREKAKNNSSWIIKDNDGYAKFPIYVKQGNKITFSYTEKLTTGKKFYLGISLSDAGSTVAWLYHDTTASLINNKYTIAATNDYIYLMCSKSGIQNFVDTIQTLQVEISPTQTDYQTYAEQPLTLTSDRQLTKWDRLVEQGGQIGWLYGTEKYVVTGKENFSYGSENYYTGSRVDMFFEIGDATGNEAIMRDLSLVPSIWHLTDKEGFCINGKQLHIRLYNTRIGVSDGAAKEEKIKVYKEFMAKRYADGNPFEVYYKTTETEFVPLPQSEQNAIRALKTYYTTTVITADGGELDPDIKVTYRKEI